MPSISFDLKDMTRLSAFRGTLCLRQDMEKIERRDHRAAGMTSRKVRGVLFSPTSVEQVVRDMPELSDEFEVVVTREDDYDRVSLSWKVLDEHAPGEKRLPGN